MVDNDVAYYLVYDEKIGDDLVVDKKIDEEENSSLDHYEEEGGKNLGHEEDKMEREDNVVYHDVWGKEEGETNLVVDVVAVAAASAVVRVIFVDVHCWDALDFVLNSWVLWNFLLHLLLMEKDDDGEDNVMGVDLEVANVLVFEENIDDDYSEKDCCYD